MANKVVITYKDIVLRRSDLDLLEEPCYLNDQIIGFYCSHLTSIFSSNDLVLVLPFVSFWLANCQDVDSGKDFVEPLKLDGKNLVFFMVNDNDDLSGGESGTRWSLVVYYRNLNVFAHHDSMEGVNNFYAMKLYEGCMGNPGSSSSTKLSKGGNKKKKV